MATPALSTDRKAFWFPGSFRASTSAIGVDIDPLCYLHLGGIRPSRMESHETCFHDPVRAVADIVCGGD